MMAKIAQFFAKNKLTVPDTGVQAWETAGRRIGPLYNQIAEGEKELGKQQAALANESKFWIDRLESRGGGSARGGSARDALDFGARSNWGSGYVQPSSDRSVGDEPGDYQSSFNSRAHQEISRAAAALPQVAQQLSEQINGGPTTVLRGAGAAGQPTSTQEGGGGGLTIIRGGQPQQTVNPQDMAPPGSVTVMAGGRAPYQTPGYPAPRGALELPPGAPMSQLPYSSIGAEPLPGSVEAPPVNHTGQPGVSATPGFDEKGKPIPSTLSPGVTPPVAGTYQDMPPVSPTQTTTVPGQLSTTVPMPAGLGAQSTGSGIWSWIDRVGSTPSTVAPSTSNNPMD
jgi:hypothetical protein